MDAETFQTLFKDHRDKIFEAWNRLTDKDLNKINGNLELFLDCVSHLYTLPREVILRQLDQVKTNIDLGIKMDFGYRLNPEE